MDQKRQGLIQGLVAAVAFGLSAPLISTVTSTGSTLALAGLLYGGSALVLLAARVLQRHSHHESAMQQHDLGMLGLLTLIGGIVAPICLVSGLSLLSAGSASMLLNLEAVFTMGIAILVGREHLSPRGGGAAALILAGAIIIGGSTAGATWHGALLIALACLGWGIDNNISQRLSIRDPIQIAGLKSIGAALPMLLMAGLTGATFPKPAEAALILLIGAVGYGVSIWLDLLALRHLGAAREAVVFATAPFVGAGFAVLALKEPLTLNLVGAAALMIGGVALLLQDDHGHWHRHDEVCHDHKHLHHPEDQDPHHDHLHGDGEAVPMDGPVWHSHPHQHNPIAHAHQHVSDAHHRHQH